MSRVRKALVWILVLAVLVGAALGWSAWRKSVVASKPQASSPSATATSSALPTALTGTATATATTFETQARTWGTPLFDKTAAEKLSITEAIKQWRVSDDCGLTARRAALEKVTNTKVVTLHGVGERDSSWGSSELYANYPDYWSKQLYTLGVNVVPGSVRVSSIARKSDGTLSVKVSVRQQVVVYTPPSDDEMIAGQWTFAPSVGYYDSVDTLRLSADGTTVAQLPDGSLQGLWFLAPLVNGFKSADSALTGLSSASERDDQSVVYKGDDFRSVDKGLYPDPLFMGDSGTVQVPAPERTE